jgi:hypothetical protein
MFLLWIAIWFYIGIKRKSVGSDGFRLLAGNFPNLKKIPTGLIVIPSLTYWIVEKVSPILISPEYSS